MPEKVKGKVKWFSNRKGFGFVAPESGGEDIFLHHSKIVSDAEYKTLRDGLDIEFEIGTDEEGKKFADKVTLPDGSKIPPPEPRKRNKKKEAPKEGEEAAEGEEETKKKGRTRKNKNGKKAGAPKTWFSELDEDVQTAMTDRKITIEAGRAFVSLGDARLKLGTGGYITLAHAGGIVAEGSYTCEKDGKVVPTWEHVLKLDGDEWKESTVEEQNESLVKELSLKDEAVKPTGEEETPATLWGEGKPDPKEALEKNGFQMRKVALTAAANPGRRGGRGPRNRKRGGKQDAKPEGGEAPAPAAAAT